MHSLRIVRVDALPPNLYEEASRIRPNYEYFGFPELKVTVVIAENDYFTEGVLRELEGIIWRHYRSARSEPRRLFNVVRMSHASEDPAIRMMTLWPIVPYAWITFTHPETRDMMALMVPSFQQLLCFMTLLAPLAADDIMKLRERIAKMQPEVMV